jgi:hypothetical protein
MYHYFATILGIRPASLGFTTVRIRPQLGPLEWARGSMVHPKGVITVDVKQANGKLTGNLQLPPGVKGQLHVNGTERPIQESQVTF